MVMQNRNSNKFYYSSTQNQYATSAKWVLSGTISAASLNGLIDKSTELSIFIYLR